MVKIVVGQVCSCSPWRAMVEKSLQALEDSTSEHGSLKDTLTPCKAHTQAGSWLNLWSCGDTSWWEVLAQWGSHAGAFCSWRNAAHGKDPYWRSNEELQLVEGLLLGNFMQDCLLWQGKSLRSRPPAEERATEMMCEELTRTPIPVLLCCWQRRIQEWDWAWEAGSKVKFLRFGFYFSLP